MKKIMIISLAMLATLGASAQSKLSTTITDMLDNVNRQIAEAQQSQKANSLKISTTAQECPVDTAAIQYDMVVSFNADGTVKTLNVIAELADGATCPTTLLEQKGIKVNGEALGDVFMTVPVEQLEFLESVDEFTGIFADGVNHPMLDNSRPLLNVSNVNGIDQETSSLGTTYTGKGVIVGIIDSGIDFNHMSFKDSEGNTRILKAVNFSSGDTPTTATTPEAIAAMTWDDSSADDRSHGTHVAACAAGSKVTANVGPDFSNPTSSRNLMGMAPEADLVLCAVGGNGISDSRVETSVDEIVKTAKDEGKPCVINMSFGSVGGWHDGTTRTNKAINKVAGEGVIVCMSSANEGLYNWTADKTLATAEYMKLILTKTGTVASATTSYIPSQSITFYLPQCINKNAISSSFEVVDSLTGAVTTLADTPLRNSAGIPITPSITFSKDNSHNGWVKGTMSITKSYFDNNSKFLVIKLQNVLDSDLRMYAIATKEKNYLASTDFPDYSYDKGSADISMNTACSAENFISVGSYTRTNRFGSYNGSFYRFSMDQTGADNATSKFSSYGVDDFGKKHPDVIAPGAAITSAYNYYDTKRADAASQTIKSGNDGAVIAAYNIDSANKMNLWYVTNGTSMAAPVATGVVALWLQAYPTLTAEDVRNVIIQTSRNSVNDTAISITSGNPVQLGYGLIDAEAGLQYILEHYATAINGVTDDNKSSVSIVKKFINGNIVIEKDGKLYNAAGQNIR